MNTVLILLIGIPLIEIYLFIKIGSQIGAFNTVLLIITTAIVGVAYARYEGFNTLKSGIGQIVKNELPLLIIPLTRKIFLNKFVKKNKNGYENKEKNNNFIEGEYEDINENDDKKI